ncbi:MAG: gliding motility-associated protein GldE [Flavobacteriales bacterium]|nr:gliding motility-associated protein GldE [Flavobacteriales bacterium]
MDPDPEPFLFLTILLEAPVTLVGYGVSLIVLLLSSALISGSEVAFFSLSPTDFASLEKRKSAADDLVLRLLDKPKSLLATILITNNFINILIVLISTLLMGMLFHFGDNAILDFAVKVVGITFVLLLFGEVLPKVYANRNALNFSKTMSQPLFVLSNVLRPVAGFLIGTSNIIERRLKPSGQNISVEDLSTALEITSDEERTEDDQRLLEGIVKFGSIEVRQIMKPRMDIIALDTEMTYPEVLKLILENGYSRLPAFQENLDQVSGILYIKDLLRHLNANDDFKWPNLLRPPFFVRENKKIDDLLKEFQERKMHMAVVVDEYGGTSGLVTMEDVLEEIVGDISDEFDDEDIIYSKLDDDNYVFEGKTPLNDFYRVLDIERVDFDEVRGDSDTLAGFLLEISGKFPRKNEVIDYLHYRFKVEGIDHRRIKRIKVTVLDPESTGNEE